MNLLRPRITDARGSRLALLAPFGAEQRPLRREIQRRLDAAEVWTPRRVAIAVLVSLPAALSILTVLAIVFFEGPIGLAIAAVILLAFLPGGSGVLLEQHIFASRYRDAYIGIGICPSCGYDLAAAVLEADKCRVCPECGGAWRGMVNDE